MLVLISPWLGSLEYREISPFPNTIVVVLFCLPCLSLRILFTGWNSTLYLPYMPYNFLVIPINLLYNQCIFIYDSYFSMTLSQFSNKYILLITSPINTTILFLCIACRLISHIHSLIYLHSNPISYICILISFSQMRKRGYNEVK